MALKYLGGRYYDTENSDDVVDLQVELERRGWLEPNNVDGVYGPGTDEAYNQANAQEYGGTANPSVGRASVDNPNIAPGLPGSAFGDPEWATDGSRPDIEEWQQANLGNPTTPEDEAAAIAQMVAARELADRTYQYRSEAQEVSRERGLEAQRILEERKNARKTGILGRLQGVGMSFLDAIGKGQEELAQSYYGGNRARLLGGNTLQQTQASIAGLPGLGFLAPKGSLAKKAIEQTNSYQERAALTKAGQLSSFGEQISGKAQDLLDPELRARASSGPLPGKKLPSPIRGVVSGAADLGFQAGTDPLSYVFPGATSLTKAASGAGLKAAASRELANQGAGIGRRGVEFATGRVARSLVGTPQGIAGQQAARAGVAAGRLGQTVIDAAVEAVRKGARDMTELSKRVKGLEGPAARDVLEAARNGTLDDVKAALTKAFVNGEWSPELGRLRQLSGSTFKVGVTGGIVKSQKVATWLRKSRGDGVALATGLSQSAGQVLERTVQRASERGQTFVGDVSRLVDPVVKQMTPDDRSIRIIGLADQSGNAAFRDAAHEEVARAYRSSDPAEVESILSRLETTQVLLDGKAGGAARTQAEAELRQGFKQSLDLSSGRKVSEQARRNAGLAAPSKNAIAAYDAVLKAGGKTAVSDLRKTIRRAGLEPEIQEGLLEDLRKAVKAKKGLGRVASDFDILRSPTAGAEAKRLVQNAADRTKQAEVRLEQNGLGRRVAATAAKLPLSFIESISPSSIQFQGGATTTQQILHRVEGADRWAQEMGLDDMARSALRQSAEAAKTEAELYKAVANGVRLFAVGEGLDPDQLESLYRAQYRAFKRDAPKRAFGVDANGKRIEENIFTKAQLVEHIPLPDPGDLKHSAKKLKAGEGADELRSLHAAGESMGNSLLGQVLKKGHRLWKFSIVSNIFLPAVGAVAGFGSGEGMDDRLQRAGQGFAIGLLGPARYVLRVAVTEERLRVYMAQGFKPAQWVPGAAKWASQRGVDLPFVSEDIVHASKVLDRLVGGKLLSTASNDFISLGKNDSRFPDAWWRVVNRQISPETDEVTRILLNEKAGVFTTQQATDEVKKYLKTEEGKVFRNRMAGGTGGSGSANVILDRYRQFLDAYITDPDLARARLQVGVKRMAGEIHAEVERKTLKQAIKAGMAPDYVHAQKTWTVPKSAKQTVGTFNTILAKAVFEGPTSKMNRVPLARSIYRDEYLRLIGDGVDPKRAQEIADSIAVRRTNKIMFQVNDESRFAQKADYVFPFQQPREEMLRVWLPAIKAKPGRAMKLTRLAALAFNNGQESGAFRKDPASDQWVMSVPHSAWLGDKLFGTPFGFDANIKDLLLPAQGAFTPGLGIIPNPGGPWFTTAAKFWATNHPEAFKDMPDGLKGFMFPYGIKGNFMRPEAARLWMGMTGEVPPWEFASEQDQKNELEKWRVRIDQELRYAHWKKTGKNDYVPSDDEMKKALKSFMSAWSVIGSTFPATSHPIAPGQKDISNIIDRHTRDGITDWDTINGQYPIVSVYLTTQSKYVGPDDFDSWKESEATGREKGEQFQLGLRRQITLEEFRDDLKAAQKRSAAYKDFGNILKNPNAWEREGHLQDWRRRNPELAAEQRTGYFKEAALDKILATVPKQLQDEFIDNWRREYNVTRKEYEKILAKVSKPGPGYNPESPWRSARYPEEVAEEVGIKLRQGMNEEAYVATLNPAEQVGYWKTKQAELSAPRGKTSPQEILDQYKLYGEYASAVYKANPRLTEKSPGAGFNPKDWTQRILKPFNDAISDNYAEAERLKGAMDAAAKAKQWDAVYAMKDKRDALFDQIKDMKNNIFEQYPQLSDDTDIRSLVVFANDAKAWKDFAASPEAGTMPWLVTNEQAGYLGMPANVQKAFVGDLMAQVSQASGTEGKLFWEWLTDFQKDLLQRNIAPSQIAKFKSEKPGSGGADGSGSGNAPGFSWVNVNGKWVLYYKGKPWNNSGGSGFGGKFYGDNNTIGNGAGDLAYALEKFAQYSRRADGATAPATYNEYLALPANPAVRAQYLKEHPEVGEWIKSGPLANMPTLERYIVTNIMIKYGKWEGDLKTNEEITDLSFAREQLKRWNKRPEGAAAPENYDVWLNMPPGKEKSLYLKAHPEVQDWIRLGPMSNMPDEYQTVVRDIMYRYGEWTQQQDPMGDLISEYYKTPAYARKAFLLKHPELEEYWAANRDPEEERMFQLSQQYFSMQSSTAKKGFLAANPDLQQHFVDARNKRYEKFLNQVAQFMGGNPEMFKGYLDRQNDILSELLRRYASPNLLREAPGIKSQTTQGVKARGKAA